ncbi:hypothetical protein SteCoe_30398 [Stentor coeruleus]|uniref:Uncharacterized protein n=1 Tax=Stentor coeruleus TaxID=5963 RepID=A0A1R2B3T8_9CILI|nr:hypothetical protein SteCoe_30422 [Stentor coeruleus]OMJ71407.1 hypothetical protein SteCoe_30398 [Stentor coeruleus]
MSLKDQSLDLATKMIEKEHELERFCNPKTIHELISIYSQFIEYYSLKHDSKYLDIQNRMHKMLTKPEVLSALKSENSSSASSKKSSKVSQPSKSSKVLKSSQNKRIIKNSPKKTPAPEPNKHQIHTLPEVSTPEFNAFSSDPQANPDNIPNFSLNSEVPQLDDELQDLQAPEPPKSIVNHLPIKSEINPFSNFSNKSPNLENPSENDHIPPHFGTKDKDDMPYAKEIMMMRRQKSDITRKNIGKHFLPQVNGDKNSRSLKIMIDRHVLNNKNTANKAAAELKSQESALERRLASRQKIKLSKSMSFMSTKSAMDNFKCDLSELYIENDVDLKSNTVENEQCEKFEKKLEEIMEKNFAERALKIAEIKHKYESQMSEIEGMGDVMQMLIQQMKVNMKGEIDGVVGEYDKKRKELIDKLKAE